MYKCPILQNVHLILLVLCLLCSIGPRVSAQQELRIGKIEFQGLQRLTPEEVVTTAALKVGDRFDIGVLDAAAQRLADSGLFKSVAYHTQANRDLITITFQVEEVQVTSSRVVFDNFVWFTDTDLIAAVRRDVPTFNGSAPDNGDIVERITKSLQRFLHEHQIEATVNYMASQDSPGDKKQDHVFSVIGIPLPICTLHFPGASDIPEAKLIDTSKPLFGTDYSGYLVGLFAAKTLIPNYRELGHLKATFAPPQAKPEASATCRSGIEVTLPVDEGSVYNWDKAEWTGNAALTSSDLDRLLPLQPGHPADGLKLDESTGEIQKGYGRKGYLMARINSQPLFDDAAHKVIYKYAISEGRQFRMGKFSTRGFNQSDAESLMASWHLKAGEIYDQGYASEFIQRSTTQALKTLFAQYRSQGKPTPNIQLRSDINKEALIVDVIVELKN